MPDGDHPVKVTLVDVSDEQVGSHIREGCLSLILADGVAATVENATSVDGTPAPMGPGDSRRTPGPWPVWTRTR